MASPDRDRDERGRPKNARPRDELGRPLPRDGDARYVEEPVPEDPDDALRAGIEHFDAQRFFQAHEMWESVWHGADADEREFWQGITQIAVGFTHWQRKNPNGSVTLLRRGARRLAGYGETHRGIPVARLAREAMDAADRIDAEGVDIALELPRIGEG